MYFIINKNTRALVRESASPFNIDENVQPPDPLIQLKRIDNSSQPGYNPATHKLVYQFTDDDVAKTRTFAWAAVPMSQEEIDSYNLRQTDNAELVILRAVYNDLKNGVGTAAERLNRVERATAFLLRSIVR
jgi:hypothetical protein